MSGPSKDASAGASANSCAGAVVGTGMVDCQFAEHETRKYLK